MNRLTPWVTAILLCLLGVHPRILLHDGSVRLSDHQSRTKLRRMLDSDFKTMLDRRLTDRPDSPSPSRSFIPPQRFKVRKSDQYKKLKFMEIVSSIRRVAKERRLRIKSVQLGRNIRTVFENKNVAKVLNQFINDPKFDRKLATERRKYTRYQQSRRLMSSQRARARRLPTSLGGGMGGGKKKGAGGAMNFSMSGDMTQMPFPPMVMNGPHYHPPMNITINQLPNMNPRSEKNPIELQLGEYQKQSKSLGKLLESMDSATGPMATLRELKRSVDGKLGEGFNSVKDKALD